MKVAIIGSGIAGLAAAVRLSLQGHEVSVFEASDAPGGKMAEIKNKEYRFDAGPSLFTLPALVDELFELAGENPRDYFNYEKLDIVCNYFYPDGTAVSAYAEPAKFTEELSKKLGEKASSIEKALLKSKTLYDTLAELFVFSSLHDFRTFISKKAFKAYAKMPFLGFTETMNKANKRLFDNPKTVQFFNRFATYNGSDPHKTPATMNIIPHLEMGIGAFFPKGGMYSIPNTIYELAIRSKVKFHFKTPVQSIRTANNKAIGIMANDQEYTFDRIVSNVDVVNTYKKLLPHISAPKLIVNQPKSSSALIFYWGIKKKFKTLDLHNIFFSSDYTSEFDHIFNKGTIFKDPTIYVNISSKKNTKDAPVYGENWFTMINVPNNQGQDWDTQIAKARENMISKLSSILKTDISELIESEDILDPRSIESRTGSSLGALYGNSSNNLFAAFLRHANVSKRVKNLYFCGGSVHPGGGIPLSLSSAKIMAQYFR
ncbi:MAG: phytoene desaturase [Cyclobacteriaceae bacterium]